MATILTLCTGWRDRSKLVADLRSPIAYEPARFEVGIWAGLRCVGLAPRHEVAENRAARRADFVVSDGNYRVAIELKSLADPQRDRNAAWLQSYLLLEIDTVGTFAVGPRDPSWPESMTGSIGVRGEAHWTAGHSARRVLRRVAAAERQLVAATADLRATVVWGRVDHAPCQVIAAEVARLTSSGYDVGAVDYICVLNSHRRERRPGWTTEAVVLAVRAGVPDPDAMTWPKGLTRWSLLHRNGTQ